METAEEATESTGLDIGAAADSIGRDLFPPAATPEPEDIQVDAPSVDQSVPDVPTPSPLREVPKSWRQDMHEHWGKIDPKVQEYWETREKQMLDGLEQYKSDADYAKALRRDLAPYQQTVKGLGLTVEQAAKQMFQADHALRYASEEQKIETAKRLMSNYGIDISKLVNGTAQPTPSQVDPHVKALQDQMNQLQSSLTARQEAELNTAREKAGREVDVFASDTKAHPYFDEVTADMPSFLSAGLSLQDAYERAVWANPVTRAKEIARVQTETEAKLKENARLTSLPKKHAAALNVRSRDTKRAPTEPVGTMEDTIKEKLAEIKARA